MTKWFFSACFALLLLPGCPDSGTIEVDDDDASEADDDTTDDLGCNEASVEALGWDEEVEWWMDTADVARDLLVGAWAGEIPWSDGGTDWLVMAIEEPTEGPTLTTYPDAEPAHALDACLPWASFPVQVHVELPYHHIALDTEATVEISEYTIRWDMFVQHNAEDCDNGDSCVISIGSFADPDFMGTLPVRMTAIIGENEYHMGIDGYAPLEPLPGEPELD